METATMRMGAGMMAAALIAVTGAGAAMAAVAPGAAMSVKDGVDAWQRGDYIAAVAIWRPLAAKGDADAAFDLAQAYKLGRGVPTDLAQAKTFYGQAARGGHEQAAANYGLLLFQDGDRSAAMPWIQKASEGGDPRAQYVYGTALFNGDLAPKDWPKAYALMTRAAAAGLPQATTSLAQMDQYLSPAEKQKGLALAGTLAARPMPPISRQAVATSAIPPSLPPAPAPIRQTDIAASTPPAPLAVAHPAKPPKAPPPVRVAATPAPVPLPARTVSGGGWRVQLGAFGSESAAATAWSALVAKAPGLRGLSPSYERAGAVVRLRATGLADKAAAAKACVAAKAGGAACFPVAP